MRLQGVKAWEALAVGLALSGGVAQPAVAWPKLPTLPNLPHPPPIPSPPKLPSIHVGGLTISPNPLAPVVPTAADQAAKRAAADAAAKLAAEAKATADAASAVAAKANEAAKAAAAASVAAPLIGVKVVTGSVSLTDAMKQELGAQGAALEAAGKTASEATEQQQNLQILTAGEFAGDDGKTILTILTGPDRLQSEFATTLAIQSGQVLQGADAARYIAAPLAAAMRAAESQFSNQSKPVPDAVKQRLMESYTKEQLDSARYTLGGLSISLPDVITKVRKAFGDDFGVTVGHVMVFSSDPGTNYHWWAHELQHTVQYTAWGIDNFAYKYVINCHAVEEDAEQHAQAAVPLEDAQKLGC